MAMFYAGCPACRNLHGGQAMEEGFRNVQTEVTNCPEVAPHLPTHEGMEG